MRTIRNLGRAAMVVAAAGLAITVSACGSTNAAPTATGSVGSAVSVASYNQQDVDFATGMIPHHEQAIVMADMVDSHSSNEDLRALAERITAAQSPEIDLMSGWLEAWGEPSPDGDGMGMHDGHGGSGMMDDDDIANLDAAAGDVSFDDMWLTMMIAHHEGAIEMAQTELDAGEYGPALDLARSIITSQTAEIDEMKRLLD